MARLIIGLFFSLAVLAQPLQDSLRVTRIYDIKNMAAIDNRSESTRMNNLHTFLCAGTGSWSCQIQYSDTSTSGPWSNFLDSTSLVTQASISKNGRAWGYYKYIRILTTGTVTRVDYAGLKDIYLAN